DDDTVDRLCGKGDLDALFAGATKLSIAAIWQDGVVKDDFVLRLAEEVGKLRGKPIEIQIEADIAATAGFDLQRGIAIHGVKQLIEAGRLGSRAIAGTQLQAAGAHEAGHHISDRAPIGVKLAKTT